MLIQIRDKIVTCTSTPGTIVELVKVIVHVDLN